MSRTMHVAAERCAGRVTDSATEQITRWLLIVIGIYSIALLILLNVFIGGSGTADDEAIILMSDNLILPWIIIGGSVTPILRAGLWIRRRHGTSQTNDGHVRG